MTTLAIYAAHDSPGKRDASAVFRPEARALVRMRGGQAIAADNRRPMHERRDRLLTSIASVAGDGHGSIAIFCHGWASGIQLGPRLRWGKARTREVDELAEAIRACCGDAPTVVLYACSTGTWWRRSAPGGDGGFADELRDALCRAGAEGCMIYAHDRLGHATRCPYVRVFRGDSSHVGGEWLIGPGSALWPAWRMALWGAGDLRLRFPFMSREELESELRV